MDLHIRTSRWSPEYPECFNALTWVTSRSFRSFTYSCTIQAHDFKIVQTCTNMQHVPYKYTDLHFMRPSCIKDDLLLPRDRQAYSQPKQQHDSAPAAKHRHGCRGCRGWGCVQMRQGVVERISDISAWLRCLKLWIEEDLQCTIRWPIGPRDASWEILRGDLQPNDCSGAVPQLSVMSCGNSLLGYVHLRSAQKQQYSSCPNEFTCEQEVERFG